MPEPADRRLTRIVQLVADLSRVSREGQPAVTLTELGARYGVRTSDILHDIRILTSATADADQTWLSSVTVIQERDRVTVESRGPYRRPIRLSPDELLVLLGALAADDTASDGVRRKLRSLSGAAATVPEAVLPVPAIAGSEADVVAAAEEAMRSCRALRLEYLGEGAEQPSERIVEVHDIVGALGRHYLHAWCRSRGDWRRFRADRVLAAALLDETFVRRADAPVIRDRSDLFVAPDREVEEVRVRFSPAIARWIAERYPRCEHGSDGSVVVRFRSASVDWLVRHVLQYGDQAEVLEPTGYREALRRAVGG